MLVYDITNEKSFDNIKNWIRNIEEVSTNNQVFYSLTCCTYIFKIDFLLLVQHASGDVEKMVLGNKCDINDKRQVSKDRGEQVRSLIFILCRGLVVFKPVGIKSILGSCYIIDWT